MVTPLRCGRLTSCFLCVSSSLFGKPFDGGKRMDHGGPQQHQHPTEQQQPYHQQHPAMTRLYEVHGEVASLGPQVCTFSGLQDDRDYKRLERELTRLLLQVDQVDTEGKPELQGARKRAAQEVEGLLRYLEENATHPSRAVIEEVSDEARQLVDDRVVAPQRSGGTAEINDELVDALQVMVLRLTQVKTEGRVPLRKARYRALTRLCAVQDVIEGRTEAAKRFSLAVCPGETQQSPALELMMRPPCFSHSFSVFCVFRYDLGQNNSIREIEAVRAHVSHLRDGVLRHCVMGDLSFRPKAELQGLLTHLDQVDTAKNPCIREARRRAVVEVQAIITFLDLREALARRQPGPGEHPAHRAVWLVLGSLSDLQAQALGFDGKRVDKSYILLEELLTKQLLALDAVDPQGDDTTKMARKQAVKFAQNILNYLDMKTDEWEY
uniref:BAG family molecular chaperone regulator 5 n=1 Tax=Gasterosteus aculeatus aculeatus TaxID=481459 RepID=A0AAQ4P8U6_GASAC